MSQSIKSAIVLVTGANRGIGKSIVETLLAHGAAKVYAAVRDVKSAQPLVDKHGARVVPIAVDLAKPETIKAAATKATDVTIVINNAGILVGATPLSPEVFATFQQELEVNVYGLLHMAQAFAPVLKANGGGAFVQLNSVASLKSFVDFATYAASKATAYSFTQALRDQLATQGTLVVSVHPGPIATDMGKDAGLMEIADSPQTVADGIVAALENGTFHVFPDKMAKDFEKAYAPFAKGIVEANLGEG